MWKMSYFVFNKIKDHSFFLKNVSIIFYVGGIWSIEW